MSTRVARMMCWRSGRWRSQTPHSGQRRARPQTGAEMDWARMSVVMSSGRRCGNRRLGMVDPAMVGDSSWIPRLVLCLKL